MRSGFTICRYHLHRWSGSILACTRVRWRGDIFLNLELSTIRKRYQTSSKPMVSNLRCETMYSGSGVTCPGRMKTFLLPNRPLRVESTSSLCAKVGCDIAASLRLGLHCFRLARRTLRALAQQLDCLGLPRIGLAAAQTTRGALRDCCLTRHFSQTTQIHSFDCAISPGRFSMVEGLVCT